ncbi:hypothetical protein [Luteipulveratus halotolerans]|uniref:Uncharacterized protein n=1 Tax=Luteipulveratus halotolerans TaxID=1631356 RepID=A0A0L6CJV4_9MICO|nr:hypothetical protein [Luteipulveratus halotolerans]KNX38076.1 hypothetical protein VV01_14485 [Luteipulveratus halotolerans]
MTSTETHTAATELDLDAIRARHAATTEGPWFWWGNTDNHSAALCGRQPGVGVCEVVSTVTVDRSTTGREADVNRESLREYTTMTEDQIEDEIRAWAAESWDQPRSDARLALTDENHIRRNVEDVAVYQVARAQGLPDDTPRDDERVYRADICDVRNPNGKFLAASWADVRDLIAEVERLRARVSELEGVQR